MTNVPQSIGIILDGNRRWAKERGLPTLEGHREGLKRVKEVMRAAFDKEITTAYLYVFSTENWNRAPEEVSYLMTLFEEAVKNELREVAGESVRLRFIGDLSRLPENLQSLARTAEEETKNNTKATLAVALSYGGRADIVSAVNKLIKNDVDTVTEELLTEALSTQGLPHPDLIIRTSGEERLSNFLPWEGVYSELYFTKTLWPDFTPLELDKALEEYAARERRHGK